MKIEWREPKTIIGAVVIAVLIAVGIIVAPHWLHSGRLLDRQNRVVSADQATGQSSVAQVEADPVVAMMAADVQTPVYFLLSNHSLCQSDNGSFTTLTANIVRKSDVDLSVSRNLANYPEVHYSFLPGNDDLLGVVLSELKMFGPHVGNTSCYDVGDNFLATAVSHDGGWGTATYRVYDVGQFVLDQAKMINEYTGSDPNSGANTKFRSYQMDVSFKVSAATEPYFIPSRAATISCVVVVVQDQASLQWKYRSKECKLTHPQQSNTIPTPH